MSSDRTRRWRYFSWFWLICPATGNSKSHQDVHHYCDDVHCFLAALPADSVSVQVRHQTTTRTGGVVPSCQQGYKLRQLMCQPHHLRAHVETFPTVIHPGSIRWCCDAEFQVSAERCNYIAMSGYCYDMLSVCRLSIYLSSVTRVYCDKTTEVRFTRFSHKSSVTFSIVSLTAKFEGVPLIGGSN